MVSLFLSYFVFLPFVMGMCKSKYIPGVMFLFLEFYADLHKAFSVVYRPT